MVGADFSEQMLELASDKALERGARDVTFEWADALELPYSDSSFDAVTVGFGVRNLADLGAGFREIHRVLKPGGRCVILEITQPQKPPLSTFFALWFDRIVPLIGRVAGDPDAYSLPARVRARASRRPRGSRASWTKLGWRASATPFSPGGSSQSTRPRGRPDPARAAMNRSTVPPPVTQVMDEAEAWLPRLMGSGRVPARRARRGIRRGAGRRCARHAQGWRQAPPADARPPCARGRTRASRPCEAPLRSNWSTWRRSSTTTCSTRRRFAAACRPSSRLPAATRATAVGDLLLSRAFAELVEGEDSGGRTAGRTARRRLGGPRARRARAAP